VGDDVRMADRPIDPRVQVGFVTLRVNELVRSVAFYRDILGFHLTQQAGQSSALLSADGRHPLIRLEVIEDGSASTATIPIRYPDRGSLADAFQRLSDAGLRLEGARNRGTHEVLLLSDPDGHHVELYCDRPRELWPLEENGSPRPLDEPLELESLRQADRDQLPGRAVPPSEGVPPLTQPTRAHLGEMRTRLLTLHKVLLDDAKAAYEMDRGRVASNANLLQLVINDPWFAWLHPLSELVVRIDETLQADAPATEADGVVLLEQVERLISRGQSSSLFGERYYEALQRQPAVIMAHAEVRRILKQAR
jgi:catechol 2,3-dioxygenase